MPFLVATVSLCYARFPLRDAHIPLLEPHKSQTIYIQGDPKKGEVGSIAKTQGIIIFFFFRKQTPPPNVGIPGLENIIWYFTKKKTHPK